MMLQFFNVNFILLLTVFCSKAIADTYTYAKKTNINRFATNSGWNLIHIPVNHKGKAGKISLDLDFSDIRSIDALLVGPHDEHIKKIKGNVDDGHGPLSLRYNVDASHVDESNGTWRLFVLADSHSPFNKVLINKVSITFEEPKVEEYEDSRELDEIAREMRIAEEQYLIDSSDAFTDEYVEGQDKLTYNDIPSPKFDRLSALPFEPLDSK